MSPQESAAPAEFESEAEAEEYSSAEELIEITFSPTTGDASVRIQDPTHTEIVALSVVGVIAVAVALAFFLHKKKNRGS